MLMKFTKAINIYENKVYGLINAEYDYQKKLLKAKPKVTIEDYEKANLKGSIAVEKYNIIKILIFGLQELFNFGRYSYEDKSNLIDFILDELNHMEIKSNYLDEAIKTLTSNKEALLAFTKKAEKLFLELSKEENVKLDTLNLFGQQRGLSYNTNKYWILDSKLKSRLDNSYIKIKTKVTEILNSIVRCSSIVENINSQIRPYLFLKRVFKCKFLYLLQFYLNTRKYLNSRVKERKGKSPLEFLAGKDYGNWLDILGY